MEKWENLRLESAYDESNNLVVAFINGQEIGQEVSQGILRSTKLKRPDFDEFITGLGEEGWELVTYAGLGLNGGNFLFKRML